MPLNITIDHATSHGSDHSSLSDEEDSSGTGVQVSPPSATGSHEYHDHYESLGSDWAHLSYPDELKPSDSASRPRTSNRHRNTADSARARRPSRHHSTRRRTVHEEREPPQRRSRRPNPPASPESDESGDEYYARGPPERRFWPPAPAPPPGYAHSSSSGPSYSPYSPVGNPPPHGGIPHAGHPSLPSNQLVQMGPMGGPQYDPRHMYGYGSPFPPGQNVPPGYFNQEHHPYPPPHHHPRNARSHSRGRHESESPPQPAHAHPIPPHVSPPFPSSPFPPAEMIPYGPRGSFMPYGQPFPPPGMHPHFFPGYPRIPSPGSVPGDPAAAPAPDAKDDAIARLEKLIIDERAEREAKEAAREAAIEQAAREKAAAEERAAAEKKIAEEAAAKATIIAKAEAKAEAEKMAAEEAERAKKAAEEAAAAAAAEATIQANEAASIKQAEAVAAARAEALKPPPEKKKPIKFKDAVGRKFSFPFHLCNTWQGMEELIRQAFLHVDVIGPHVAEGHYDLVGPNGDIILPQVWQTVIEPDWTITMHMWPMPEKPKEPDPPPLGADDPLLGLDLKGGDAGALIPPPPPPGPKKPRPPPNPGAFAMWMTGGRAKPVKSLKAGKKPEVIQQPHVDACCVM